MNPDLSHVRVTVIDFMGVFLPGTIWFFLLCSLNGILSSASPTNPIDAAKPLFDTTAPKLGASFYVIVLIATLITGYIAKSVAIKPSETITTLFDPLWNRFRRKERLYQIADYRFPYDARYRGKPYYEAIVKRIIARAQVKPGEIESKQIFNMCKRLLKLHAPQLWEEAEYREAEVRMLASLFLASLFNFSLVAISGCLHQKLDLKWASWAIAGIAILWLAFRLRRRREVESVYFATLAALILIPIADCGQAKDE